ncbi:BnaC07g42120D [Brassica napus]|uniref:BnaC07g42120D protein n=1 Tax=Brassica napus TaxID=3708 RepID=A0A078I9B5_BRANA|nr:BnaC07g42120D [Brassica napus]
MSAPGKFDYSSGGPDRTTLYRSNLAAAQMERSSTFRQTVEHHPVSSSSHPNALRRSTSPLAQTDVTNFFQCLRFDPKVVAADHKSIIRHGDFKRHVNIALGIQGDESPSRTLKGKLIPSPVPEEIKRLKAGLRENNVKARERVKIFNEASSVFNKFFPTVPTKKRSRPEGFSSDRLALGPGLGKMGIQGQTLPGCFEFDEQNVDERPKSGAINKRTRTSMMDVRSNAIVRAAHNLFFSSSVVCQHGAVNGAVPYGRSDSLSRQTGLAGGSLPSRDSDHSSLYNEKRERAIASDKERVNLRAINKSNIHDESNSSSPKINVTVRGPRSGSGLPPKLSPVVHNTPSPSDWDISGCTNKPPLLSGVPNRKRMTSNRSSSPPVTQWAGQRPKKISRVARRTSLVPFVSSNDDIPSSDNMSDVGCSETSFGFPRRSPAASPRMRLKGENSLSTTALSGSEEFSPPEIKSKDKGKQSDEVKAALNVRKLSITGLQSRKNKLVFSGEELGDGVRRQGRTGRGFGSTRSVNPMGVMRHGTTKQLRSARNSSDKNESRVGRPPTRKLSDRKAYKRQRNTSANATTLDFLDDGHEELLAAVNSAINLAQNFPSSFWKQMERYFCFISDAHISFLKQPGDFSSMGTTPVGTSSDFDGCEKIPEGLTTSRVDSKASPLYQRLLSALISEDSASVNEDLQFDGFGADAESEFSALNHVEFNGYRCDKLEFDELDDDVSVIPLKGGNSSPHNVNGRFTDHLSADFSDIQYETLGIDEKIYLEAQSIGICLEPMANISNVEDEGIVDEIKTLEEAVYEVIANFVMLSILKLKGSKKKEMLNRLLTPALEMKELQEKEFDRLGYEKLIEMAYEKSKASRRHHSASGKSSANKISKQAAFAFTKRTLGRCRQFEETGKSCFSESTFKNILVAGLTQIEDNPTDKEDILSASTPLGSQPSSSLALRIKQNTENYADSSEHTLREGKDETMWLNRTKERELLLDDVCGTPLSSSTKGKRSDRDRDGKGQASSSRGGGTKKMGRPALSNNTKGERKSKTKPRLKTTPMFSSPSVSILEQNRTSSSKPTDSNNSEYSNLETLDETEPLDLSGLQIPDGLGGPDDFDAQAGDLSSWLNIDDDALQENDIDLLGLQIPMDDLSDLKMMV